MKTVGRILIILVVFVLVMGITYTVVNASSNSSSTEASGDSFQRPDGDRPEFGDEGRPDEFRGEGRGFGATGILFGAIKNIGIVAFIVAVIVVPKSMLRRKKRESQPAA